MENVLEVAPEERGCCSRTESEQENAEFTNWIGLYLIGLCLLSTVFVIFHYAVEPTTFIVLFVLCSLVAVILIVTDMIIYICRVCCK